MSEETFAAALRAELDAVVARYEALVRALASARSHETDALRAEAARLAGENQRLAAAAADHRAALAALEARVAGLDRDLAEARARADRLEGEAHAALEATLSYEEQFTAERRFVEACRDLGGTLLGDALAAAAGPRPRTWLGDVCCAQGTRPGSGARRRRARTVGASQSQRPCWSGSGRRWLRWR